MWIWFVVAIVAAIGELLTYDLFLAPVATAALVTAVFALLLPITLQVGVFAALSLLGIIFLRPVLKHTLGLDSPTGNMAIGAPSNVVRQHGIVTKTVDEFGGQIRIGQAEFWTARPFDPAYSLAPGEMVEVLLVEGLTALVALKPEIDSAPENGSDKPIQKGITS